MAIHLISGVPGAGKTLRAVYQMINELRTEDGSSRPFFGNVNGLKHQAEIPEEWMDVPDGSLILIDEVQQRWRRYRNTGEPPAEIAALEKHRHRGIDFILTCQNPSQLTADVRALVDTHEHLMRKGKLNGAILWRWEGVCHTNPASHKKDADCEASIWRYPKWVFEQYQSATIHTGKRRIPRIMLIAPVVLATAVGAVSLAIAQVKGFASSTEPERTETDYASMVKQSSVLDAIDDDRVKAFGGAIFAGNCSLYDDTGTRLLVSQPVCREVIDTGLPQNVQVLNL